MTLNEDPVLHLSRRIRELEAENTLMNELVSDQKKRIEALEEQVNRLSILAVSHGCGITEVRNIVSG